MRRWFLGLVVGIFGSLLGLEAAAPPLPPPNGNRLPTAEEQKRIAELIRQLGSEDLETREKATRVLSGFDVAAPALRRAADSSDVEVRRRARSILLELAKRRAPHSLASMKTDAADGIADLLAERMAHWAGKDDAAECWQPLLDLGWRLVRLQSETFQRPPKHPKFLPNAHFNDYLKRVGRSAFLSPGRPDIILGQKKPAKAPTSNAVRGERVVAETGTLNAGLIAASDSVRLHQVTAFILSGGNVRFHLGGGVVVCDGNITIEELVLDTIIVARGNVTLPHTRNCVVLAGGDVTFAVPPGESAATNTTIRARGDILPQKARVRDCVLEPNAKNVFGPIKFFDPADLGIVVGASKNAVRVSRAEKAFATAGVKVGDLIAEVDGKRIDTPEAFRRMLRRLLALESPALLRVRRDARWLEIEVPLAR